MFVALKSVEEDRPGEKWKKQFDKTWPYYEKWYVQEGLTARKGYLTCISKLEKYMPELLPIYEELCKLAGNGDLVSRYLSLWRPPAYMSGCTQLAWNKPPFGIIRNYDYDPKFFDGVLWKSDWLQPVIGVSDCNWGLLDGINGSGLAVSLTFGGRKIVGKGFGIPLIVRYVLETCQTTPQAVAAFKRIPSHMAYNIAIIDKTGSYSTLFLSPDRPTEEVDNWVSTNHQGKVEWDEYAAYTGTLERKEFLDEFLTNPYLEKQEVIKKFFQLPLYHKNESKRFMTLYTAIYNIPEMKVDIRWPNKSVVQSFDHFTEGKELVNLKKKKRGEIGK